MESRYLWIDKFPQVAPGLSSAFVWLSVDPPNSPPVATVVRLLDGKWSVLLTETELESEFDTDSDAMLAMIWWFGALEFVW